VTKIKLKSGDEQDALTSARKYHSFKSGELKKIKRGYNKRLRKQQLKDMREQQMYDL
jgi:hypothetical protein